MTVPTPELSAIWQTLFHQEVVLDMASSFVILGQLVAADGVFIELLEADVHDLRDSKTTRDLYVLEARRHGIRVNRARVVVRLGDVVGCSPLADVIL